MKRPGVVLLTCVLLGIVVIMGAGLQGAASFTGLRWVPDFSPPKPTAIFPTRSADRQASPVPQTDQHSSSAIDVGPVLWAIAGVVVLIALLLLIRWLARRPPRTAEGIAQSEITAADKPAAAPEPSEPSMPVVRRGLRRAIEDLADEREPHDAIVKAWLGLQDAAEEAGMRRRPAETPTEFTGRVLARVPADAATVDVLLACYLQARFGDHPVTDRDVARVGRALESLAGSWDAAERTRRASAPAPPWERPKRVNGSSP